MTNADEMLKRIEAIDSEMTAYAKAMTHADDEATLEAMAAHVDELFRDRCRVMGLPENEITRIEQESDAAVEAQLDAEIESTLAAMPKSVARKLRRALRANK